MQAGLSSRKEHAVISPATTTNRMVDQIGAGPFLEVVHREVDILVSGLLVVIKNLEVELDNRKVQALEYCMSPTAACRNSIFCYSSHRLAASSTRRAFGEAYINYRPRYRSLAFVLGNLDIDITLLSTKVDAAHVIFGLRTLHIALATVTVEMVELAEVSVLVVVVEVAAKEECLRCQTERSR